MKKRNIIFSHESDIDGLNCIILGKIAFAELDYVLCPNPANLEQSFRKYMELGELDKYNNIYITDLALYDPSLTKVAESSLKDKVQIFDHHKMAIDDNMNRYSFTKIIEKDETGMRCGTELFYEYLVENNLINSSEALTEFVELTRLEDTWEWKKSGALGEKAHSLAILFNVIGIEKYISRMISKLVTNPESFKFDTQEMALITRKKEEYNQKLQLIMNSAEYFLDDFTNKYGIVFADYEYRNELAEYIKRSGNPEAIKYLIIVAMNKGESGQKSYRTIEENFDVNEIANLHGGGGHPESASVIITKEQSAKALTLSKKEGLKYLADCSYPKQI